MRRIRFALVSGLAVLALAGRACAAPGVDVDEHREYPVTPEIGPWMISVTYFAGTEGAQLAHDLVLALRRQGYPAYIYNRSAEERRKHQQEMEELHRLNPEVDLGKMRTTRIHDEYAVLIGGYKDIDAARTELDRLRTRNLTPEWLKVFPRITLSELEEDKKTQKQKDEAAFRMSFVVRNPTVPVERPKNDKPDPFLKELNAGESYSLLKCKSSWTLAVKELRGPSVLMETRAPSDSFWGKIGLGNKSRDALNATALQAHEVARILREHPNCKFEAYVLHTRYSSVVTIGGFDSPNDPRLLQVKQKLGTLHKFSTGSYDALQLFAQPLPMQVPQL